MKKVCKQCGKEFELSDSEIEYFKSKNLSIPKRCKECREQNKTGNQNNAQVMGNYTQSYNRPSGGNLGGKIAGGVVAAVVLLVVILGIYVRNMVFNPASEVETSVSQPVVQVEEPKVEVEVSKPEVTVKVEEPQVEVEVEKPEVQFDVENPAKDEQVQTDTETEQAVDEQVQTDSETEQQAPATGYTYRFRSKKYLNQHYEKHGIEMGFASAEEYEAAASAVINNPDALYKTEKEDGDGCYYIESTNEFVVLSTDGYIRTYFNPDSGKKYFDKQ